MAHNCIVVNLDRCTGCYSCEITCKMENDIALGEHWNKMLQRGRPRRWRSARCAAT